MIETTLTTLLKAISPNVFPNLAPANTKPPLLIYTRSSTDRETVLSGPTGLAYSTFRVNVYADSFKECVTLSTSVRTALNGYSDDEIQYCRLVNEVDLSELDKEDPLNRRMLEFRITHHEQ